MNAIYYMRDRNVARASDVPGLIERAERVGWRVEEDNGAITLCSPVGKYGDWARIRITERRSSYRRVIVATQRSYHAPNKSERGLWFALKTLEDGEQWRYAKNL